MNAAHVEAALFALAVVFVFGAGIGAAIWHTDREIDRATRLPERPRPLDDEPPTERVEPALSLADFPRRKTTFEEYL